MRADDELPVATLAGTTDVSFPAPGLSLDFSRQFMQSISGRNTPGTLGLGWVSDWDISATTESDGSVLVEDAGAPRVFTPQANGTYEGEPGDYGILSLLGGAYQLRETDGTVEAFLPSGQLNYVQDSDGNRITAGYNASGQMVSLTDSDGQALTLAYNGQGLISTITDPNGPARGDLHLRFRRPPAERHHARMEPPSTPTSPAQARPPTTPSPRSPTPTAPRSTTPTTARAGSPARSTAPRPTRSTR